MKVAVMQPYFFPYLGYFQLVGSVDSFVYFDDVQYIRRGYINKNSIASNGNALAFSVPVKKAPREASILEVRLHPEEFPRWRKKWLAQLGSAYAKTAHFDAVIDLVSAVTDVSVGLDDHEGPNIGDLARASVEASVAYLGLETRTLRSSELDYERDGSGQDKVLSIATGLGADTYVNPPGGRDLYDVRTFQDANLDLAFLQPKLLPYAQGSHEFIPDLSILDLMFRRSPDEIRRSCLRGRLEAAEPTAA